MPQLDVRTSNGKQRDWENGSVGKVLAAET